MGHASHEPELYGPQTEEEYTIEEMEAYCIDEEKFYYNDKNHHKLLDLGKTYER